MQSVDGLTEDIIWTVRVKLPYEKVVAADRSGFLPDPALAIGLKLKITSNSHYPFVVGYATLFTLTTPAYD